MTYRIYEFYERRAEREVELEIRRRSLERGWEIIADITEDDMLKEEELKEQDKILELMDEEIEELKKRNAIIKEKRLLQENIKSYEKIKAADNQKNCEKLIEKK